MIHVDLDPDGTWGSWVGILLPARTGVTFFQQCGGVANEERSLEGYFTPTMGLSFDTSAPIQSAELRAPFHRGKRCNQQLPIDQASLEHAVTNIPYWERAADGEVTRNALELDLDRVCELSEAWAPVRAGRNVAVLVWDNCD